MSNLYWLIEEQMSRLRPFFPKSHGRPRVDDRRVISGIIFIIRNGYGGATHRANMVRQRHFTIAGTVGAIRAYSLGSWKDYLQSLPLVRL